MLRALGTLAALDAFTLEIALRAAIALIAATALVAPAVAAATARAAIESGIARNPVDPQSVAENLRKRLS